MQVLLNTSGGTSNLSGEVTLTASISASAQATSAEFYLDDVLLGTDTSAPFTYVWDTSMARTGRHQLKTKIYYPRRKVAQVKLSVTVAEQLVFPSPPLPSVPDQEPVILGVPVLMEIEE